MRPSSKRDLLRPQAQHLRENDGLSYGLIAERIGVAERTVRNWLEPDVYRRTLEMNRLRDARRPRHRRVKPSGPLTWENANWANAGAVQAWLREYVADHRFGACGVRDIVTNLSERERVSFWTVDRCFTTLGLHVAQLPDEVWVG